jgi:hypothetical protein
MRPKEISFSMDAADRNGISVAQQTAGAANLTITGAYASGSVAALDVARHVTVYSAGNLSARTFTITGTDRNGAALTEAITGPNATTVTGDQNFKTITRVAVDGAVGTNVEIGTAGECELQWIPIDPKHEYGMTVDLHTSPDMTWSVEGTLDNPWAAAFTENSARVVTLFGSDIDENWAKNTAINDADHETANYHLTSPLRAVRVVVKAYTAGTLEFKLVEGRG